MRKALILTALLGLVLGPAGCGLLGRVSVIPPEPPRIFALSLGAERFPAGAEATVRLSFRFEDRNADVGPEGAEVEIQAEVLSGNLAMDTTPARVLGAVRIDEHQTGQTGSVELIWTLEIPSRVQGLLRLSVALFDRAGQRSNFLSGEITIGEPGRACIFLDGDHNPVTSYRAGRQAFFRVVDPDNNTDSSIQDVLRNAAYVQAGATGDRETIPMMVETGPNTGVFEGPVSGLLLVSRSSQPGDGLLSVRDRDTIIAIYQDPSDPGDVCLALAKLR